MSEFRFDPIKRDWVIVASDRGHRPSSFQAPDEKVKGPEGCPFCTGNEGMTPPEVYALRDKGSSPDGPGWRIRVVPNKYPALSPGLPCMPFVEGVHSSIPGCGVHEIIIETTQPARQMPDMEAGEVKEILLVWQQRLSTHLADGRFKSVIAFKNHGREAGASLAHSHSQVMALPVVPNNLTTMVSSFAAHRDLSGKCLYCEIVERETGDRERVIQDNAHFVTLAPFAAESPFQVRIVPLRHGSDFTSVSPPILGSLASLLLQTLRRLRNAIGEHPWNLVLYSAPAGMSGRMIREFHWFMEITPRITTVAGFEMGSGFSINTMAPEECARHLRSSVQGLEPGV